MKKNTNRKFFLLPILALVVIVLSTAFVNSFNLVSRAVSPLSCNMVYGMSYKASVPLNTTTLLEQYNPANNTISELSSPILPGRTRASAISPDGNLLVYYDDIDNRVEWYNFSANTFGNGATLDSDYSSGGSQANRMAFAPNGKLYMLIKNNQTSYQDLIQIDTTNFALTLLGPMTDKPTNSISINSILGGDIVFDGANIGYLVDNNGSLFKFDPSSDTFSGLTATYLSDISGINSTVAPSGLGFAPNGNLIGFTSAGTGIVTKIDLDTLSQTTVLNSVGLVGDAFSCASPTVTAKPEATKEIFKVTGADSNGLGGTLGLAEFLEPGNIVEYKVIATNKGIVSASGVTFQDDLPTGTTYIPNSTTLNGSPRTDISGIFVHLGNVEIHSPNSPAEIMVPDKTPNIIDNEAVITYRVKINDPFTQVPRQIRNQGILKTDEVLQILTDNPATPVLLDATINPVEIFNEPPVANPNSYGTKTLENVVIKPLDGDTDPENTTISIVSINGTALTGNNQTIVVPNGVVNIVGGVISFVSDSNYTGTTGFPYVIKDAKNKTAFSNITIVVSPALAVSSVNSSVVSSTNSSETLNSPATSTISGSSPTIINPSGSLLAIKDVYTTPFNTNLTINPTLNDENVNQLFSINGVNLTGSNQTITVPNGVVQIVGNVLTFVPNTGFSGESLFPYTIRDLVGNTEGSTIKITIGANPNPQSSAVSSANSSAVSSVVSSANSSIISSTISSVVSSNVSSTNSSLIISSATSSFVPSSANSSAISSAISSVISSQGSVASSTNSSQNPSSTQNSSNSLASSLTSSLASSTNSSSGLIANKDIYSTNLNTNLVLTPMANDILGTKILAINGVVLTGNNQAITAPNGILEIAPTSITFVPNTGFVGTSNFAYSIQDANGNTATSDITITINPLNNQSSANSSANSSLVSSQVSSLANSQVSSTISSQIPSSARSSSTNSSQISSQTLSNGSSSVSNSLINSSLISNSSTSSVISISSANNSSQAQSSVTSSLINSSTNSSQATSQALAQVVDDNYKTNFGESVVLKPLENDKNVEKLIFINGTVLSGTNQIIPVPNGTVEIDNLGNIKFVPAPNYTGTTQFSYIVKAKNSPDLTGMIAVEVGPKETIEKDAYSGQVGVTVPFNPMLNDSNSKKVLSINNVPLTGQVQFIPVPKGTISVDGFGNIFFKASEIGTSFFEYSVESNRGNKLTSEIIFNIISNTATNNSSSSGGSASSMTTTSPKQTINDNYTTLGDTKVSINPKENDTGISDIIKINNIDIQAPRTINVANGKVEIDSSKNLSFVPDTNFVGLTSFEYTAKMLDGSNLQATVSILVESNTVTPPVIVRINSSQSNNQIDKTVLDSTPRTGGENLVIAFWLGLILTILVSFVLSRKNTKSE